LKRPVLEKKQTPETGREWNRGKRSGGRSGREGFRKGRGKKGDKGGDESGGEGGITSYSKKKRSEKYNQKKGEECMKRKRASVGPGGTLRTKKEGRGEEKKTEQKKRRTRQEKS